MAFMVTFLAFIATFIAGAMMQEMLCKNCQHKQLEPNRFTHLQPASLFDLLAEASLQISFHTYIPSPGHLGTTYMSKFAICK
mmetsp:Transcript_18695/g.21749  ORF Transcript_18695/g.21749 Transcript_18695/m.21749 type:complete len:82 (+) Transcript_18695:433-678(+)